jgi:hypothetical protein
MSIPNPTIELYGDKHTPDFPSITEQDAEVIRRMWNEWYDRHQKEAKEYTVCRHKAEIVDAANQYEL